MTSGTALLGTQSTVPAARRRQVDHRFYTGMAFAMAARIFAGFMKTYYARTYFHSPAIPFWVHVHGAVFTGWILFYLLQNLLAMYGQMKLHRRLGILGGLLASGVVVFVSAIALRQARQGRFLPFPDGYSLLAVSFKKTMDSWNCSPQVGGGACGEKQAQGIVTLTQLVERRDNFSEVVDIARNSLCGCCRFERSCVLAAHEALQGRELEKLQELLLARDFLAGRAVRLRPPYGAQDAVAIEFHQVREQAWARDLWGIRKRKHLDVASTDAQMVAMPFHRCFDELTVYANIGTEMDIGRPLFKFEEIAEELENLLFAH